jgi:sulfate transport system ATP-binding protein
VALDDVSVTIPSGELVALLGPSGSGKTTLLRVIAGLEQPDAGDVLFDSAAPAGRNIGDRSVGFVFQHYALFRHMTVFENVAFGLRVRPRKERASKEVIAERVHRLLSLVQLDGMATRFPSQLSGGQRQRVALARALAVEPRVLLLDEPFGSLDARVRLELRRWLRRLHDDLGITSVFVTHDQEEALEVADRIVIMDRGRVQQVGSPQDVYDRPATPFVYDFLGSVNLFHGRLDRGQVRIGDTLVLDAPEHAEAPADRPVLAFTRPHDLEIKRHPYGSTAIEATVQHVGVVGPMARVMLRRGDTGDHIEAQLPRSVFVDLGLHVGEQVWVRPRAVRVFPHGP